jgi:hypothetical protein
VVGTLEAVYPQYQRAVILNSTAISIFFPALFNWASFPVIRYCNPLFTCLLSVHDGHTNIFCVISSTIGIGEAMTAKRETKMIYKTKMFDGQRKSS